MRFRLFSNIRKSNFFKKLLFSYMALLLVVVGILAAVMANLIQTISGYTDETAWHSTRQYQAAIEEKLRAMEGLSVELSFDHRINALLSHRGISIPRPATTSGRSSPSSTATPS